LCIVDSGQVQKLVTDASIAPKAVSTMSVKNIFSWLGISIAARDTEAVESKCFVPPTKKEVEDAPDPEVLINPDQSAESRPFPKLFALGQHVEKCIQKECDLLESSTKYLLLSQSIENLREGQHRASTFNKCMESLQKQYFRTHKSSSSTRDKIPVTKWDSREPWSISNRLFQILEKKLRHCRTHQVMFRLNGFQLDSIASRSYIGVFLSSCQSVPTWGEGKFQPLSRYVTPNVCHWV
jgi:hypothetical protein